MKKIIALLLLILAISTSHAQLSDINPNLLQKRWDAHWIAPPDAPLNEYGVYHFRKTFSLVEKPDKFIIHVSADNRYQLSVNGHPVSAGPSRGDLKHWRFESVDLAKHLVSGENVISAVVWNFGEFMPWAQISYKTGFILQGDSEAEELVNTNETWKVFTNQAYSPIAITPDTLKTFIAVGPCERIEAEHYPWGWNQLDYDDELWQAPKLNEKGAPYGYQDANTYRLLVPRTIPFMEEKFQRIPKIVRAIGITPPTLFLKGGHDLEIPGDSQVSLLLDQTFLTTAFPELLISGGKNSQIKLSYAEALMNENLEKSNRNDIKGKQLWGIWDEIIPDGQAKRKFRPLWFRTFRYIQIDIQTADDPVVLHDFYGIATGYPFKENATFSSSDKTLESIWDVGWRTARLCAGETYYDCPYYEQLQYVGDTRIQALISLYVSGDDRLMKKAIELFNDSRTPDGLTSSRYPTSMPQVIPPYSLFWISMIHDYWMFRDDLDYVKQFSNGIQGVIAWYENYVDDTGMLGPMPWWNFVDWPDEWAWDSEKEIGGVPAGANDGNSSNITLQFVYTLYRAADLLDACGDWCNADRYREMAEQLKQAVYRSCWDSTRNLIAETPSKQIFSQHANIMAVLVDLIPQDEEADFIHRVAADTSLIQATFYFKFYLFRALKKAGLADEYLAQLEPWYDMLDIGLTTFAERPEPTRSDCHAWSASPNYDFLATVCGIEPAESGFKSVIIKPALGDLKWIKGAMPHPQGTISIDLQKRGKDGIKGTVTLPENLSGEFEWNGDILELTGGEQVIKL